MEDLIAEPTGISEVQFRKENTFTDFSAAVTGVQRMLEAIEKAGFGSVSSVRFSTDCTHIRSEKMQAE